MISKDAIDILATRLDRREQQIKSEYPAKISQDFFAHTEQGRGEDAYRLLVDWIESEISTCQDEGACDTSQYFGLLHKRKTLQKWRKACCALGAVPIRDLCRLAEASDSLVA